MSAATPDAALDVITAATPDTTPETTPDATPYENYEYVLQYLPLFKAAIKGDWETARGIIENDVVAANTRIAMLGQTALHIAVGAKVSRNFVKKLVDRIVDGDPTGLRAADSAGCTALHIAAAVGNTEAAKILVEKDPGLTQVRKNSESVPTGKPLNVAAFYAQKHTLLYLLEVTNDETDGEDGTSPYTGVDGGDLITCCIDAGFYDVARDLVRDYPQLAYERDRAGRTALEALATKPQAFASGTHDHDYSWFWKIVKYSREPVGGSTMRTWQICVVRCRSCVHSSLHRIRHQLTRKLSKLICSEITKHNDHNTIREILGESMSIATECGVYEIVEDCLEAYPSVLWYSPGRRIPWFLNAIKHRQANVCNIIHQLTSHKVWVTAMTCNGNNNALHMAAKLAPSHRLNTVTGAALRMQRELQWFKEVKARVQPSYRDSFNKDRKTPRMLFTDEHAHLVEKGEQWMKTTASSSTVVAALIITVAFTAAFAVPGGNTGQGAPILQKQNLFMLFIISDAIALFSASTSVLMFLSILTSRYAEEDFLYSLPIKLTIGLLSLFFSIAATMTAFGATLALVIRRKGFWIPLFSIAGIPIMVFALLQSPLLWELVISTCGRSIFRNKATKSFIEDIGEFSCLPS